jgi:peptide/nickel transport system permease protein
MRTELLPQLARRPASPETSRPAAGAGPYRLAFRRLGRDRAALAFGGVFVVIAAMCLAAPLYAR